VARTDAIEVEGVVVAVLSNTTYRVELANGHRLVAFVAGKARTGFASLPLGARVNLEMSAYDLSEGRIVVEPAVKTIAASEKAASGKSAPRAVASKNTDFI
jgi:translation initiation factor IF-1